MLIVRNVSREGAHIKGEGVGATGGCMEEATNTYTMEPALAEAKLCATLIAYKRPEKLHE